MKNALLSQALQLPCGVELPNRLAKAAMTEGLATAGGVPTPALNTLYRRWSAGGAGLLLTGNVIVDRDHLERPGNVVIDREPDLEMAQSLAAWAEACTVGGNQAWVQLSHAGRQTMKAVNPHPRAPSAVKLGLPGGQFGTPVALTRDEIAGLVERFAVAARAVCSAGFTGIQVHAAHGYLLSQFLSPRSNQRQDEYGGSLENRSRLLLQVVAAVRDAVGPAVALAVKLNSADFQRGGFDFGESLRVAKWLEAGGVDLIEISGGTYEQPRLLGVEGLEAPDPQKVAASTLEREAYFVDFALAMRREVSVPLMVTGGFRTREAMQEALASGGVDVIGLGRPMCLQTDAPARLLAGAVDVPRYEQGLGLLPDWLGFLRYVKTVRTLDTFAGQYWFYAQLDALGKRGEAEPELSVLRAALRVTIEQRRLLRGRYIPPE
jgi:2,4-dienoyl-CoA reductase-like NADH-dependent reductase (Old Yellow Enzyme family)